MIVVHAEIWKQGNPRDRVDLGTLHISNVGHEESLGDYAVELLRERTPSARWMVLKFNRARGAWALILEALRLVSCELLVRPRKDGGQ